MDVPAKLQFRRLPPEAQRAAFWRLAWSGMTLEQMAERTGWSVEQVRRLIDEETMPPSPQWQWGGSSGRSRWHPAVMAPAAGSC
jgi:hypothetical protein